MKTIRRQETRPSPWKNGRGIAHQIAVYPEGASIDSFIWRLSLGEGLHDTPISPFPGVDRLLLVMEGHGAMYDFGEGTVVMDATAPPFCFPGEAPATGWLIDGPTVMLNVMTQRGRASQHTSLATVQGTTILPSDCSAVICRTGLVKVGSQTLHPGDTALLSSGHPAASVSGAGQVVLVSLMLLDDARPPRNDRLRLVASGTEAAAGAGVGARDRDGR